MHFPFSPSWYVVLLFHFSRDLIRGLIVYVMLLQSNSRYRRQFHSSGSFLDTTALCFPRASHTDQPRNVTSSLNRPGRGHPRSICDPALYLSRTCFFGLCRRLYHHYLFSPSQAFVEFVHCHFSTYLHPSSCMQRDTCVAQRGIGKMVKLCN